jgi:hypothetical protein
MEKLGPSLRWGDGYLGEEVNVKCRYCFELIY